MGKKKVKKSIFATREVRLSVFILCLVIAGAAIYYYKTRAISVCYSKPTVQEKAVCFASEQYDLRVAEVPAYSNRGKNIDIWNQKGGCSVGSPWCAAFISYELYMATGDTWIRTCSTSELVDKFMSRHRVIIFGPNLLKIGDVVYRTRPDGGVGAGHVGIVKAVYADGGFQTLEGNTSCGSNDCVKHRYYDKYGNPKDADLKALGVGAWTKILRW